MDARPNRRDLIKMGVVAGGIAAAGPVITTFNVPAAAALTSACTCTDGKTLVRKEWLWDTSTTAWVPVSTTGGSCRPSCWAAGDGVAGVSLIRNNTIRSNSPMEIQRGSSCDDDANEGLFSVTALYANAGATDCVGPSPDGEIVLDTDSATITAAAGKSITRVFAVACC